MKQLINNNLNRQLSSAVPARYNQHSKSSIRQPKQQPKQQSQHRVKPVPPQKSQPKINSVPRSSLSSVEPRVDILIDLTSDDCNVTNSIQSNIEDLTEVFLVVNNDLSSENVDNIIETDRLLGDDPGIELEESNTIFEDELSESTPLN